MIYMIHIYIHAQEREPKKRCTGAYTKVGIKEQQLQYIPAFDISSLYIVCAFEISRAIF
jgi:hypothetical protein